MPSSDDVQTGVERKTKDHRKSRSGRTCVPAREGRAVLRCTHLVNTLVRVSRKKMGSDCQAGAKAAHRMMIGDRRLLLLSILFVWPSRRSAYDTDLSFSNVLASRLCTGNRATVRSYPACESVAGLRTFFLPTV